MGAGATSHFDIRLSLAEGELGDGLSDVAVDDVRLESKGGPVPTIVGSAPSNQTTGVSVGTGSVTVTFSHAMNPTAVEASMSLVCDDGSVFGLAFTWTDDLTEVALAIDALLTPAAECWILPGNASISATGAPLSDALVFHTGDRSRDYGLFSSTPLGAPDVNFVKVC